MSGYQWTPGGSNAPYIYITQPGTYSLNTIDQWGCYGNSGPFVVNALPQAPAPLTNDTTICAGQSIQLNVNSNHTVAWYATLNSNIPIHIGNTFTTPIINANTTYYLQNLDTICSSIKVPLHVFVHQSSLIPIINGQTTICDYDSLCLSTPIVNGANYYWNGPSGFTASTNSFCINNLGVGYVGMYTLYIEDNYCVSPTASINISVNTTQAPVILPQGPIYLCPNQTITLYADTIYSNYTWLPDNQTTASISISQPGSYQLMVTENGCASYSNVVQVLNNNPIINPTVTNATVCMGDNAILTASGNGQITWYDSTGTQIIVTGSSLSINNVQNSMFFMVELTDINGCVSQQVPAYIIVPPLNQAPPVSSNSPVCEGDVINLFTTPVQGATYNWTGPSNFTSNAANPVIPNATAIHAGTYSLVVSLSNCSSQPATINIIVNPKPVINNVMGITTYCEGDTLNLLANGNYTGIYWQSSSGLYIDTINHFQFSPITLSDNAVYLSVYLNICYIDTVIPLTIYSLPYVNIQSNAPLCVGNNLTLSATQISGAIYTWEGPANFISNSSNITIFNAGVINSGNYNLSVIKNGCQYDTSITANVVEYPLIDLGPDTAFCSGNYFEFILPTNYTYLWHDGSASNTYMATDSGMIYVQAFAGPGCATIDSVYIDDYDCNALLPNVFSPNGDGVNDYFMIPVEGAIEIDVKIFNRWGNEVYGWKELDGYWDGKNYLKIDLKEGIYFYVVNYLDVQLKKHSLKGNVILLR